MSAYRNSRERDYWDAVRARARELGSDGCTMGSSLLRRHCLLHDIHYRTRRYFDPEREAGLANPITRKEADLIFLRGMQRDALLGWWSPVPWARYFAVRLLGKRAWKGVR